MLGLDRITFAQKWLVGILVGLATFYLFPLVFPTRDPLTMDAIGLFSTAVIETIYLALLKISRK
jgi:hypothetical protein